MQHLYGTFGKEQFEEYKKKLHKELFWLLLYKDPETRENFSGVNFERTFAQMMRRIDGLNELLMEPQEIVGIMALCQAALIETRKEEFDYSIYRKLVLDAHSLVDRIKEKEE